MLRAIVFDFDGVIANSEPLHFQAYRDVLAEREIALLERDYYARYLGFDDVGAFQAIAADCGLAWTRADIDVFVARKAVRLEELERDISVLFPGAADAVRRAAALVPIAIASGARGEEIRRVLQRENLTSCFTAVVAAEDTAISKPAPDPYLRVLALLRTSVNSALAARDCVAIEDSHWGLQSARAAGMRTVAVTNTYEQSALVNAADLVIPSLDAIDLEALASLCPES
jgi:beta-phosphoglucomutase-like phosphatase (HAD superfamily)